MTPSGTPAAFVVSGGARGDARPREARRAGRATASVATYPAPMARPRPYAAFLRGVMPTNCKMPALRAAFEADGLAGATTVLGTGNVVFTASGTEAALATRAEAATERHLGRRFATVVWSIDDLAALLDEDPFAALAVPADAKRVVSFLRAAPRPAPRLPVSLDGACVAAWRPRVVFTHYRPSPRGPVFMKLLADLFGDDLTTRTWDTVRKVVAAGRR